MKLGNAGRTIRVGVIGLGNRSREQIRCLVSMKDVEIVAVCDVYADRVERAQDNIEAQCGHRPEGTLDYREVNARGDIEAVFIFTSWQTHVRIAVDAMNHGKTPAMEVGGASSLEECWELVRTSEATGIPVMLLENCCYNKEEMALLNMVRQGIFGEIVHCRGGYQHDLREEIGNGDINMYYLQVNRMLDRDHQGARQMLWDMWNEKRQTIISDDALYTRFQDFEDMINRSGAYLRETEKWHGGAAELNLAEMQAFAIEHLHVAERFMSEIFPLSVQPEEN